MTTRLVCIAAAVALVSFGGCLRSSNRTSTHPPADISGAVRDATVPAPTPKCVQSAECGSGWHCLYERCVQLTSEGGDCDHDSDCLPPFVCNWAKGHYCTTGSGANERCEAPTDCRTGFGCSNYRCECYLECPGNQSCGRYDCVENDSVPVGETCGYNSNCICA